MNAYKTEVVLSEEGQLSLRDLPFHVGETVEVIVLGVARNGHGKHSHDEGEVDSMYRIGDLIAGLPDLEGAPRDWAENFDAYRFGLKKA